MMTCLGQGETDPCEHVAHSLLVTKLLLSAKTLIDLVPTLLTYPRVRPLDKQSLKGYLRKWHDGNIILGSAFFTIC